MLSTAAESINDRLLAAGLPRLPRGAWLQIDVAALQNNLAVFQELVGPSAEVAAVVKADGYGHGLKATGLAFQAAGADRLCVASLDEAVTLRDAGVTIPILVLFAVPPSMLAVAAERRIDITVSDAGFARDLPVLWNGDGRGEELVVHVEVETGLSRAGVAPVGIADIVQRLASVPHVNVAGLWTHMASPDEDEFTARQVRVFDEATARVASAGLNVPHRHIAATGGLLSGRVPAYEGVRVGLGLYGLVPLDLPIPSELRPVVARLQPAMTLKCHALRIERFPPGTRVSYGGRWEAKRESVIATLPVGYGDAIPRSAPWGEALVRGRRVPMVGNVAMDAVMVDITDVPGVGPDDEFVLLGRQGDEEITAAELSRARNTIPWEVATSMSYRLPRVYHAGSVLMGLRTLTSETRVATKGDRNA